MKRTASLSCFPAFAVALIASCTPAIEEKDDPSKEDTKRISAQELSFPIGGSSIELVTDKFDDIEQMKLISGLSNLENLSKLASSGYFLEDCPKLDMVVLDSCQCPEGSLRFKNLPNLSGVGSIGDGKFKSMEFTECFKDIELKTGNILHSYYDVHGNFINNYMTESWADNLVFDRCSFTKYSVDWNRIKKISVGVNRLSGVVPYWLESAKDAMGGSCGFYDHKYRYSSDGHLEQTYDYGFWYSGEPDCKYHNSKTDPNGPDYYTPVW